MFQVSILNRGIKHENTLKHLHLNGQASTSDRDCKTDWDWVQNASEQKLKLTTTSRKTKPYMEHVKHLSITVASSASDVEVWFRKTKSLTGFLPRPHHVLLTAEASCALPHATCCSCTSTPDTQHWIMDYERCVRSSRAKSVMWLYSHRERQRRSANHLTSDLLTGFH